MDLDGIREALRREPFQPFSICLAEGRALAVPHPEFVAIGPRRIVVVHEDDTWLVVEPRMIVSLEFTSNGSPADRQGQ